MNILYSGVFVTRCVFVAETVIIQQAAPTRVVPAVALFGPQPMRTVCPQCDNEIVTVTDHEIGGHAIMWCVILCLVG